MNVYEIMTERIVAALESGSCPWRKTWKGGHAQPRNISGREYRGINVFILGASGCTSPFWLTFRQAVERGGYVRKGERGTPVVLWRWADEKDDSGTPTGEQIPFLRYYTLFNVEQCEGINVPGEAVRAFDPIAEAEAIVAGLPADAAPIREGAGAPAYWPGRDEITMPKRAAFKSSEGWYATLFHELTHSTGHQSRLARAGAVEAFPFGSHGYSREELVAEMGAAFLCGHAGILPATIENSAAYLRGWAQALKGDSRAVVIAAAQAQKAADWILSRRAAVLADVA